MAKEKRYTINDITRLTGASCVVIYSRLKRLKLFNKKVNNKYLFTQEQVDKIVEALKEDRRYTRQIPFTDEDKQIIVDGLKEGMTEEAIAKKLHCHDSTISKFKKRMLELSEHFIDAEDSLGM